MSPEAFPTPDNEPEEPKEIGVELTQPEVEGPLPPVESNAISKEPMSTRRILMKGVALSLPLVAAQLAMSPLPKTGEEEAKRIRENLENVFNVETPHAQYKIVYSRHYIMNNPEIVANVDGVVVEGTGAFKDRDDVDRFISNSTHPNDQIANPQYKEIFKRIMRENKPLYLVDINTSSPSSKTDVNIAAIKGTYLPAAEAGAGVALGMSGVKDLRSEKTPTRRRFLKGISKIFGGAYLGSHLPAQLTSDTVEQSEQSSLRKMNKTLTRFNNRIHPETTGYAITMRNTLIAQKSEAVAQELQKEIGKKPVIAILIGADHVGIEDELKLSEEERILKLKDKLGSEFAHQSKIFKAVRDPRGGRNITSYDDPAFK
jgi:hypothetical protein